MTARNLLSAIWGRSLTAFAAMAIASFLFSCAHLEAPEEKAEPEPPVAEKKLPPEPIKPPPRPRLYEWYGSDDYVSRIEVSIDEQKARFYSGDKEVGWTTVASGVHRHPTPVGTFAVLEKVQNKKSNLYGKIYNKNGKLVKRNAKMGVDPIPEGGYFRGAPMPYFLRLTNDGIGMHAGPIPRPGNRASHGCIRMPKKFAPVLYRYVDVGTSVTIKGNGPSYARYLIKQQKSVPKPAPAKVAQADLAPAADVKPASATLGDSAGTQPATASGTAVAAPQPTDGAAPDAVGASVVAQKAGADQPPSPGDGTVPDTAILSPSAGSLSDPLRDTRGSAPLTAETSGMLDVAPASPSDAGGVSAPVSASESGAGPATSPLAVSEASPSSAPTPAAASLAPEATETPALPTERGAADAHVSPESGGQQMVPAEAAFPPEEAEATVKSES